MNKEAKSGIIVFAVLLVVIAGVTAVSIFGGKKGTASVKISSGNKSNQIVLDKEYDAETIKTYKDEYVAALYIEA